MLREYEVCQQHINSMGTQSWQSASIFFVVNALALGFVISIGRHAPSSFIAVLFIGAVIIAVFCLWRRWIERQEFVQMTLHERMHEIEDELGMWKSWYVYIVDELNSGKKIDASVLPKEKLATVNRLQKLYAAPAGHKGLKRMAIAIIVSWVVLIVLEALMAFRVPGVSQWLLN